MNNKGVILLVGPKNEEKEVLIKWLEKKGYNKVNVKSTLKKYRIPVSKRSNVPDSIVVDVINEEIMLSMKPCAIYNFPVNAKQARMLINSNVKIDRVIMFTEAENKKEILEVFEKSSIKHILLNSVSKDYDLEKILNF